MRRMKTLSFLIIIMMGKMTTYNDKLGKQFSGHYTQEFPPHIPISSTPFDFGFEMMMRLPPIQIAMGATMLIVITYCCGENNLWWEQCWLWEHTVVVRTACDENSLWWEQLLMRTTCDENSLWWEQLVVRTTCDQNNVRWEQLVIRTTCDENSLLPLVSWSGEEETKQLQSL